MRGSRRSVLKRPGDLRRLGCFAEGGRFTDGLSGTGFDGSVALTFDVFLHRELKVGVIHRIVAASANLKDHA